MLLGRSGELLGSSLGALGASLGALEGDFGSMLRQFSLKNEVQQLLDATFAVQLVY